MRYLLLLFMLPASAVAGDLPYTFSPGTPAKASEVNENFAHLDSEIEALRTEVSAVRCSSNPFQHRLEVEPQTASPGQQLTIAGQDYIVTRLVFTDHATGNAYALTLPLEDPATASHTIFFQHRNPSLACADNEISGFPANIYATDARFLVLNPGVARGEYYVRASANIDLIVGETVVSVPYSVSTIEQSFDLPAFTIPEHYDLVGLPNVADMRDPELLAAGVDEYIDYIKIELLP